MSAMAVRVGSVGGLWRYPIKSLDGEHKQQLRFDQRGVECDRLWALVDEDGGIASGKPTRRFRKVPGLLRHAGRLDGDLPVISLADGRSARIDTPEAAELVRELAGPGWSIQRENSVPHFDVAAVHLITTSTLATLSAAARLPLTVERFRPNILLDTAIPGFPEEAWIGHDLRIGAVELRVVGRVERCVMLNHARPHLPGRPDALKTVGRVNDAQAGVYAQVVTPGTVRCGTSAMLI
jgi:uncharacterized protein YcbX